jgi:hypothetical protein
MTTTITRYVTRLAMRRLDRTLMLDVGRLHARRFAGHPVGTVLVASMRAERSPGGGWIITIIHEYAPQRIGGIVDPIRVYGLATRRWWGRHVATPETVTYHFLSPAR